MWARPGARPPAPLPPGVGCCTRPQPRPLSTAPAPCRGSHLCSRFFARPQPRAPPLTWTSSRRTEVVSAAPAPGPPRQLVESCRAATGRWSGAHHLPDLHRQPHPPVFQCAICCARPVARRSAPAPSAASPSAIASRSSCSRRAPPPRPFSFAPQPPWQALSLCFIKRLLDFVPGCLSGVAVQVPQLGPFWIAPSYTVGPALVLRFGQRPGRASSIRILPFFPGPWVQSAARTLAGKNGARACGVVRGY